MTSMEHSSSGLETERWITKECIRQMRCGTTGQSSPNWRHREDTASQVTGSRSHWSQNLGGKQTWAWNSFIRHHQKPEATKLTIQSSQCKTTTTLTLSPNTVYKRIFKKKKIFLGMGRKKIVVVFQITRKKTTQSKQWKIGKGNRKNTPNTQNVRRSHNYINNFNQVVN